MSKCLVCANTIEPFISFGKMPVANGFLKEEEFKEEKFYDLKVGFCPECKMVQLTEFVPREEMFHENYAFFSSTSVRMSQHFEEFAASVLQYFAGRPDPFVVEIGSNDGIMLRHFASKNIRHLGIEPSANVAKVASENGINTISEFFDENLAKEILSKYGQADAFLGANVMCHIPYMHSIISGIKLLLKPTGLLMFEDPYLGDIIEKTSYDQMYDEHAFYFSVTSVKYLFEQYDMEVVDVLPQNVHGGSMRYIIGHKGMHNVSDRVFSQLAKEVGMGLHNDSTYIQFRQNVEKSKDELMNTLKELKAEGKRVVGYGATSKSTTVTNYCGITPDLVEFVSDTTPIKQGKFSPGMHLPVKNYQEFKSKYPDYALLFAWNHGAEIIEKEKDFVNSGGKFILYVPTVHLSTGE